MVLDGLRVGLSIDEVWHLTPHELELHEQVAIERARAKHRLAFVGGWSAELCARTERLRSPSEMHDELFREPSSKQEATLTPEECAVLFRELAAAYAPGDR